MSTAFYPQGMSHNNLPKGYETWKGTGYFSNPIGITSGNIRPYTNRDLANNVIYKPGPRPIKHYRKGISAITPLNEYQENREVKTSRGSNLVSQLIDMPGCYSTIQNRVGEVNNIEHMNNLCSNFKGIGMIKDIYPTVNYYENPPVIMKNGNEPIFVKSTDFCCSAPKNALNLLRTTTNLKQNYYTTNYQYLQNRCQTYDQRIFNFAVPGDIVGKPGDPLTMNNYYVANCLPNFIIKEGVELEIIDVISKRLINYDPTFKDVILKLKSNTSLQTFLQELNAYINETPLPNREEIIIYIEEIVNISSQYLQNLTGTKHCGKVIYKPNNPQFATQGAVTASTYILKKDVVTLERSLMDQNLYKSKGFVDTCGLKNAKSVGNRPSGLACLYPHLYNRKYMPKNTFNLKVPSTK